MISDEEKLCRAFAGEFLTYPAFRRMADCLAWDDLYPEVDSIMRLTGRVAQANSGLHARVGDDAMMPMSEVKQAGYEVEDGMLVP